jgi:hypothetical protein
MKKYFLLISFLAVCVFSAFSQQFDWVKTVYAGDPSFFPYNQGKDVALDDFGNIITTGDFYLEPGDPSVDFDPGPSVFSFNQAGSYIQKLDEFGNFIWAKNFPLTEAGGSKIEDIALDQSGNVYAAGRFFGTADLDPGPAILNYTANINISYDLFIVKLNSLGDFQWVKILPYTSGNNIPYISDITIDNQNNILIGGNINGEIDFDPSANTALFIAASNLGFVAKYRSNGEYLWARQLGFTSNSEVSAIETDSIGNVYVSGNTTEMDLDNGPDTLFVNTFGMGDSYVMKLNANGDYVWVKNFGNITNIDYPNDLTIDNSGFIYATGYFKETAYFPNTSDTLSITSTGNSNVFVTKVNTDGEFIWAKAFNGNDTVIGEEGRCIGVDSIGNVYVLGSFKDSIDIDPSPITEWITAQTYYDFSRSIFICKLDKDGNYIRAKATNGGGNTIARAMVLDSKANIIFTGGIWTWFAGPIDVDPDTSIYEVEETYIDPIYVIKWKQCSAGSTTINESACENFTWNNQTYFESGTYSKSFTTAAGCDSVSILNLLIVNESVSQNIQICAGESFSIGNQTFNQSGIYQTVFASSNGCDSLVTTNLTVDTLNTSVVLNNNVFTALNIPPNAQLQWLNCDDSFESISGAINPNFTATFDGNYALETISGNCRDTSDCVLFSSVGLNSITSNQFNIYPIPAQDVLIIESEFSNSPIRIFDAQGRLIFETITNSKRIEIDVHLFQSGLYFIQTENISKPFTILHNR